MPVILMAHEAGLLVELERTYLSRDGFHILPVGRGEESLRLARERRPDLAVLDTAMPSPGGLETCSRFKADPELHRIPLVLVGALQEREAAKLAGAEGFLSRPVTRASLLSQIRRFVQARERASNRLAIALKITCRAGEQSFVAFTRDISPSGLFLKAAHPPTCGSRLLLSFVLPGDRPVSIESEAEVIRESQPEARSHSIGGAGLRFTSLLAETKIEIKRFLRSSEA